MLLSAATVLGGYAIRFTVLFSILIFLAPAAGAQSSCPPLLAPAPDPAKLLFTPRQEGELGEIIRQQFESDFPVIEDDQVTGYLKQVGGRVSQQLPETGLHYQFLLYDQPEIQAFSMRFTMAMPRKPSLLSAISQAAEGDR